MTVYNEVLEQDGCGLFQGSVLASCVKTAGA